MKLNISRNLFKYKYPIAFVFFFVSMGFVGEHSVIKRIERKNEINVLLEKIEAEKTKYKEEKELFERLKRDNEALREVAHGKYFMKTENEDVFVLEEEP